MARQLARQEASGGISGLIRRKADHSGQYAWRDDPGVSSPGNAYVKSGTKGAIADQEVGLATTLQDDFSWLTRVVSNLSPIMSNSVSWLKQQCTQSLTNFKWQHTVCNFVLGADARGTVHFTLHTRFQAMNGVFQSPWRHLFTNAIDGSPMLDLNRSGEGAEVYGVPVLCFDESSFGWLCMLCRPPAGQKWTRADQDEQCPAKGLVCNMGLPTQVKLDKANKFELTRHPVHTSTTTPLAQWAAEGQGLTMRLACAAGADSACQAAPICNIQYFMI